MHKYLFIALVSLLIMTSCSKKVITRKYYLIEFPAYMDTSATLKPFTSATCEILPVDVPPAYAQHRIAVRQRSHEISYYHYHQWAMDPSESLTHLIEKQLQVSSIFTHTASHIWNFVPDYQVSSYVYKLEALDENDNFSAHLAMRLELIDKHINNTVLFHEFDRLKPLHKRDINMLASTLSDILYEEVLIFVNKTKSFLSDKQTYSPTKTQR